MAIIEVLLSLIAVGLFASAKTYQATMLGGLGLLLIALVLRWGRTGRPLPRTRLDGPLGLFLLSALLSLWVSYSLETSLAKFGLLLSSVLLFYMLVRAPHRVRLLMAAGLVLFGSGLSLYFVTQNNELASIAAGKFSILGFIGDSIRAISPQFNAYQPHPNIVAGVLEVALMIDMGLLLVIYQKGQKNVPFWQFLLLALGAVAAGLLLLGLLLTGSRGAWLAVGVAGGGWFLNTMRQSSRFQVFDALAVIIIVGSLFFLFFLDVPDPTVLSAEAQVGSASRLPLYQGVTQLIRDYFITGAGLGTFPMLYSAYVLGTEVVIQNHTHNLYLAVWLEQGILGVVALLWLGASFVWAYSRWSRTYLQIMKHDHFITQKIMATAAFWAIMVVFCHGLIDSAHYNSRFLPLIFVCLGLGDFLRRRRIIYAPDMRPPLISPRTLGLVSGIILLVLLFWVVAPLRAMWYANLGAVAQAKIELDHYEWPDRIPMKLRASSDLSRPISLFEKALELAPHNATAQRRLGLINQSHTQTSQN